MTLSASAVFGVHIIRQEETSQSVEVSAILYFTGCKTDAESRYLARPPLPRLAAPILSHRLFFSLSVTLTLSMCSRAHLLPSNIAIFIPRIHWLACKRRLFLASCEFLKRNSERLDGMVYFKDRPRLCERRESLFIYMGISLSD